MLQFEQVEFKHFDKIYEFLSHATVQDTAFSVNSILAWQHYFNPKVCITDDFILLTIELGDRIYFNSPLVKSKDDYLKAIDTLESMGVKRIQLVLDWQAELLKEKGYRTSAVRSMAEYLYNTEDLTTLRGRRYHSKRNFINGFHYDHTFREYKESDFDSVMALMFKWNQAYEGGEEVNPMSSWSYINKDLKMGDFDMEKAALTRSLSDMKNYRIFADVLEIDGNIVGFCAGEVLPNNVGVIYFEKADIQYKGIYPMIDNLFIKKRFQDVDFINKQEDMGLPGLRKSKQSYYPVKLIERFNARKCAKKI